MHDKALKELDEKALIVNQLCPANESYDELSFEKTNTLLRNRLNDYYLNKSLTNYLIMKQRLFLLCMLEGTPIKSHIAKFNYVINEFDKIKIEIDDEGQALSM